MNKVTIIGATTWGTTLAIITARKGIPVTLLVRTQEEAQRLQSDRENRRLLPGFPFPEEMDVCADPQEALKNTRMVILAVPSSSFRDNIRRVRDYFDGAPAIMSATKGLEMESGKRMSQVLQEELSDRLSSRICVLSGPNLALEIIQGKPASAVVASANQRVARLAQELLMSPTFRIYTNNDVVGVELAGALKNIIALGAGIGDGLGFGVNSKAAFMTRGLAEIARLGVAAGANPLTFAGLAGVGDLFATCTSPLSRNRYVGEELARGRPLSEVLESMKNVAEGVYTTAAALKLAEELGVEMPITQATYQVLFHGLDPRQAVAELMGRPPRREWEGIR